MRQSADTQKKILALNWKMHPATIGKAKELFIDTKKATKNAKRATIVVAPPFPFLAELRKLSVRTHMYLGAQNVHAEKTGAHTGEVSVPMLQSLDVSYVILGHSERRATGETDGVINEKVRGALKAKMQTILCVGETSRDQSGSFFNFVEDQVRTALAEVPAAHIKHLLVAYEPVWAIGTGDHATPLQVEEMRLFIKKVISDIYSRATAEKINILYGGSVDGKNIETFLMETSCDGFLVGGASLKEKEVHDMCARIEAYDA